MALTRSCSRSFDSATRSRGNAYYYGRCVEITASDSKGLFATVTGSGPEPYDVELDWSRADREGEIDAYCSCPRYADGSLCKHVWATILAADAHGLAPHLVRRPSLVVLHEDELEDAAGDWRDDQLDEIRPRFQAPLHQRDVPTTGRPSRAQPPAWKRLLAPAGGADKPVLGAHPPSLLGTVEYDGRGRRNEAWFLLNVTASLERGTLIVDFYHRETKKSGGFGKIKRLNVRRTDPSDRL